jgi:hypothetical protein
MEKQIGTSAGLLALLALFIHSVVPPSSEQKDAPPEPNHSTGGVPHTAVQAKSAPQSGPWLASRQYFHRTPPDDFKTTCVEYILPHLSQEPICKVSALRELFGIDDRFQAKNLQTLIVTIPDPLHTRLSLEADRYLDAVQAGAFDARWELAAQWLPWAVKATQSGHDSDTASNIDLEQMPGLLVFRHQLTAPSDVDPLLFMFVVGETPTSGINGFQFEAARRFINLLPGGHEISVLGPNFSGSFSSLTKLIETDNSTSAYRIRSGSVSNSYYATSMLARLAKGRDVTFHGSTLPSISFSRQFKELARRQRFEGREIAQLVEADSGFSAGVPGVSDDRNMQVDDPKERLLTYRYPRDIAQLRDAYSDVAFTTQPKGGATAPKPLEFSLKDTQSGEDEFPIFSTSHTPVSQNTILEQIARDLRREGVRLINVSATNVFDTLFITSVLAKECPDVRVVVSGADLLFVEEAVQHSLSGMLAIAPFPMFPEGFKWAAGKPEGRVFADADSVGEYDATLALLDKDSKRSISLAQADPVGSNFASAWLLVLGRNGWAPVDLLQQENPPLQNIGGDARWFDDLSKPSQLPVILKLLRVSNTWTLICLIAACLSFVFCGVVLYLRLRPEVRTWSMLCTIDLRKNNDLSRVGHARYVCLAACLGSLAFLNGLFFVPMQYPDVANPALVFASALACGLPLFLQCCISALSPPFTRSVPSPSEHLSTRYLSVLAGLRAILLLGPIAGLILWHRLCFDANARGPFFTFRVLGLMFPISPIWPLLLGSLAFFLVAAFNLRRLTWADRQHPVLETSALDGSLWGQLAQTSQSLDRALSGPARTPLAVRLAGVSVIAAVVAVFVLVFPSESLRSFEPHEYETMLIALFLPAGLLVIASFIRFASAWQVMRGLLAILNSLEISRFFRRLPDFDGSGPVWMRDLKLMSLATSVNSAIALHDLKLIQAQSLADPKDYWAALHNYLSPEPKRTRLVMLQQYKQFTMKAAEISKLLSENVLVPYWRSHPMPFVQIGKEREIKTEGRMTMAAAAGRAHSSVTVEAPQHHDTGLKSYEMASEYVALQYSIYIGYGLRHIQNLLLCCVLSFVFLVLSLNSFSFQLPQAISRFTLVALLVGGIVVVRVLAQLERNPVISRISGTEEGALGKDFYFRVLTYGALPVLTVLATQFPSIGRFLSSFAGPTVEALK